MIFSEYMWIVIPGILFGLYAQAKVMSAYHKYKKEPVRSGMTGAECARRILDEADLHDVAVEESRGFLSDHYDPTSRTLRLSPDNYHGHSVAAVGIAAHEAGHALQHKAAYFPMQIRAALVPPTQFFSMMWMPISMIGFFFNHKFLWIGVIALGMAMLFSLVTLPVEFDASRRAKIILNHMGIVRGEEAEGVKAVLGAAALTYVAAFIASLLQLLHLLLILNSRRE